MSSKVHYADKYQPRFGVPWVAPLKPERLAAMSDDELRRHVQHRQMVEAKMIENPVGWGWAPPVWDQVMDAWPHYNVHILLGGNQSSKTTLGARMAVWAASEIPEAEVYGFHISDKRSIDDQQRFVYESLPENLRYLPTKKGISHSLQYTQKNGFTDGIAIMPPVRGYRRGGSIKFYNYAQYAQNSQIIEGIKAHFVWADEKIPFELFETIRMGRLGTYHGRLLLTYTVVDGWNDTIEKILAKTRTLKTRFCDHPKIMAPLPIMQESLSVGSCCIHYAWTEDNPFTDVSEFMKQYGSESRETILARAYGVPTKSVSTAFPLFSRETNVVKHEELPWMKPKLNAKGGEIPYPVTRYMAVDLGGSKGPAQKGIGLDIKGYVQLIKEAEGTEKIFERFIDPRMGAAERQTKDRGATTIISDLDDCGLSMIPAPAAPSESDRGEIEDGIQLITNLLAYDQKKPIDSLNSPRLYVSDRCENFIYSMQEYTGKLGGKENTKDFVDCLRYLRKGNCEYVPPITEDRNRTGVY